MNLTDLTDPHATPAEELLDHLDADDGGLSSQEAESRLEDVGPNKLPEEERPGIFVRVFQHFNDPLIYLLLAAAVVTAVTGHWIDTWVILAVVVVNAVIGLVQEGQAESALEGIREMLSAEANVRRDGEWTEIPAEEVVPGDLVRLSSGDRVPADARVLEATNLAVEEAALTGESVPSDKAPDEVEGDADLGDRSSMVYSGTMVTSGRGLALVTGTGEHTEIGKINTMVSKVETLATPLTRAMTKFGRTLSFIILGASAALFAFAWLVHDMPFDELFRAVVAFAVSMIPEGLPAIMTITLARGVQLMAKRNAITRQLNSVETLGSVTVICSDKTGTLTRNEMTVRRLVTGEGCYEVEGTGYEPEGSITQGAGTTPDRTLQPGGRTAGHRRARRIPASVAQQCAQRGTVREFGHGDVRAGGECACHGRVVGRVGALAGLRALAGTRALAGLRAFAGGLGIEARDDRANPPLVCGLHELVRVHDRGTRPVGLAKPVRHLLAAFGHTCLGERPRLLEELPRAEVLHVPRHVAVQQRR